MVLDVLFVVGCRGCRGCFSFVIMVIMVVMLVVLFVMVVVAVVFATCSSKFRYHGQLSWVDWFESASCRCLTLEVNVVEPSFAWVSSMPMFLWMRVGRCPIECFDCPFCRVHVL